MSNLAARYRLTIVAGMFTPASDGPDGRTRVTNTVLVASPDRRRGYDKIHLFDAFGFTESDTVAAGAAPLTFDVGDVTVGVATCYDIRFPALFTELARRGAQVIVVPTSWGAGSGKLHQWQVLATARALDCTSFVVAVGQAEPSDPEVAAGPAPTGIGHSQITDPLGSVVVAYGSAPELGAHDIDVALVEKARAALGVLDNAVDFGSSPTPGR